jgi:CBS domain-containing protein
MQVKDVMTRGCECIAPDSTLQEAARRMKELDIGPLPVCADDRLAGILTDRDIVLRAVAEARDAKTTRVRDVMTPNVTFCFDDQDVKEAARLMKEKQIRRLIVLNRDKRLAGILSLGDLAADTGDKNLVGGTLGRISEPANAAAVSLATPY